MAHPPGLVVGHGSLALDDTFRLFWVLAVVPKALRVACLPKPNGCFSRSQTSPHAQGQPLTRLSPGQYAGAAHASVNLVVLAILSDRRQSCRTFWMNWTKVQ